MKTHIKKGDLQGMDKNFKKFLPLAGVMCACLTSAAHADDMSRSNRNYSKNDDGKYREITPNAGPRVTNGADVMVSADFIYWTPNISNQFDPFATTGGVTRLKDAAGGMTNATRGKIHDFGTNFKPGFKVALGLNLAHDGWDTVLEYTWFQANKTKTATLDNLTAPLFPLGGLGTPVDTVDGFPLVITFDSAQGQYKLRFNNFDWSMGRNFYVSQYLALRPYLGLKGGWGNLYVKGVATGTRLADWAQNEGRDLTCYNPFTTVGKFSSWWVGIRGGLDPTFYFTKNWSMFGRLALSTLWTGFTGKDKQKVDVCNSSIDGSGTKTQKTVVNLKGTKHGLGEVLEWQLGLRYDYWWSDDDYHFGLEAAWENQKWDDIYPATSFQGLTVKVRFDF